MQRKLQYANSLNDTTEDIVYFNIARDLSRINSKNEEVTTRDGHVFGYLCRFTVKAGAAGTEYTLYSAPNTWKMRNAFRKFHAYRQMMFDNIGIEGDEIGRYGKTIRPLLDSGMAADDSKTLVPFTVNSSHGVGSVVYYDAGEWSYTQLATTPLNTDTAAALLADPRIIWADAFNLKICEENELDIPGTTESSGIYSNVGMIHSYNLDRMEVVTPGADEILDGPSNPLAAIRSEGNRAAGEVLEIVKDQELETPPYDLADNGDSIYAPMQALAQVPTTGGTRSFTAFLPAGLARMYVSETDHLSTIEVEVLDKILCKDMA